MKILIVDKTDLVEAGSLDPEEASDRTALRRKYLECLGAVSASGEGLRRAVFGLVRLGVGREELVEWAVGAGYAQGYARVVLSRILIEAGLRVRRPGAGPATPQEARVILAFATDKYGERAEKFLRAAVRAARAAKTRATVQMAQGHAANTPAGTPALPVAHAAHLECGGRAQRRRRFSYHHPRPSGTDHNDLESGGAAERRDESGFSGAADALESGVALRFPPHSEKRASGLSHAEHDAGPYYLLK